LNATSLSEGKTALMYAVRSGNLERAELLIQSGADVDVEDANGRTVLFDAVKKSKDAFYTLLADRVTSVDTQDSYGVTPLMIAAYEMNLSRLEDLLERGASIRLKNKAGENASDIARKHLHRHIRRVVASENKDEGSPHNTTTTEDVLKAQKYNHELREMVRRMECLADGRSYEYKKFKRPFLRTQKAN
ncbi:ankyrin repeat domain-containing protein, partial [Aduncisulcus paluster]